MPLDPIVQGGQVWRPGAHEHAVVLLPRTPPPSRYPQAALDTPGHIRIPQLSLMPTRPFQVPPGHLQIPLHSSSSSCRQPTVVQIHRQNSLHSFYLPSPQPCTAIFPPPCVFTSSPGESRAPSQHVHLPNVLLLHVTLAINNTFIKNTLMQTKQKHQSKWYAV